MAGKLYTPYKAPGWRDFSGRLLAVAGLLTALALFFYLEGGLIDSATLEPPGFLDCIYFAVVTVTTVGYGDIVPATTAARLMDPLLITPVRFAVFFIVFGTAYQIAFRRFQEDYRMKRATQKLNQHTILCGCGATGLAALRELLLQRVEVDQIVVIDLDPKAREEAAALGAVCIEGDAAREHVLETVHVDEAAHILVCPGRDDTAVLITLTVRALNPQAQVTVMCQEAENVKLLERSGAHQIIQSAAAGGTLLAAATRQSHLVDTLTDLLSVGGALQLDERPVTPEEIGQAPSALSGTRVIRVYRGEEPLASTTSSALQKDDVLVFLREQA